MRIYSKKKSFIITSFFYVIITNPLFSQVL